MSEEREFVSRYGEGDSPLEVMRDIDRRLAVLEAFLSPGLVRAITDAAVLASHPPIYSPPFPLKDLEP